MTSRATPTDIGRSIEPGSVPYGDRQTLEAGLQDALGGSAGGGGGVAPAPQLPAVGSPIEALLGGGVPGDDLPVTDGLSVGAGASPDSSDPMLSSTAQKLRLIATTAVSPLLRHSALNELRRMAGGEAV